MSRPPIARPPRRMVSPQEAARRYNVSTKSIRRRVADGSITGYRVGPRLIRLDLDEVEAALLVPIPAAGDRHDDAA
ncbi:MAG: excisionase family DNA-binding protein [Nocardioidaceae bacterium]|nr:excisionase family DNA-binding protein [Nocardioidaceae bacterium]